MRSAGPRGAWLSGGARAGLVTIDGARAAHVIARPDGRLLKCGARSMHECIDRRSGRQTTAEALAAREPQRLSAVK